MRQEIQHSIDQYIAGKLSPDEIDELWAEMLADPDAYDYLKVVANSHHLANSSIHPAETHSISWKDYSPWISAAAVLALVITVLLNIQVDTQQGISPLSDINVGQFEIGESMRDTQQGPASLIDSMLSAGMQAQLDGREEESRTTFRKVVNNYSNKAKAAKAYLNLGILDYNDDNFRSATENFNNAATYTDRTLLREKALWYKANAHIHLNEIEEARSAVLKAYAQNGDLRRESFILLKKLDAFLGYSDTEPATQLN